MTKPTFTIYQDRRGQYRWRLQARNGRIIADGAESYTRERDAKRALTTVFMTIFDADIRP